MTEILSLLELPFAQRAFAAGLALAVVSGVVGVFVVVRGMSFFSDAIAHASLLGVALALVAGFSPLSGALLLAVFAAVAIASLRGRTTVSLDALLGVFFSTAVALGVIVIGFVRGFRADLLGYLFGDVLALGFSDVVLAWGLSALVLLAFVGLWREIVLSTLHRDLAAVEGVRVVRTDIVFLLLVALVVAAAMRLVGVVLVTALLVVPAATAQNLARTFRGMVAWSVCLSVVAFVVGVLASFAFNLPSGPTIVVVAAMLFLVSLALRAVAHGRSYG